MSFAQVLTLAQQLEVVGQQAYRRFAEQATDPAIRELFVYLADEEVDHEKFFGELRERVEQGETPGSELSPSQVIELRAIIKAAQDSNVAAALNDTAASDSAEDLIGRAIEFEKAIVALFSKTRDCIGDALGQQTLDAIIAEEFEHIRTLEAKLAS
jgi:rubrerythrin